MKTNIQFLYCFVILLIAANASFAQPYPNQGNQTVCITGVAEPYGVEPTVGSTYSWKVDGAATSAASDWVLSSSGNNLATILWNKAGEYRVQVLETSADGCAQPNPVEITVKVNSTPTVDKPADQVLCAAGTTTAVTFTGSVANTVYSWVNDTPAVGLDVSGTGDIAAFTAINSTNAPIVATITVTPSFTDAGKSCPGTPQTFTITVNPAPSVDVPANQVLCASGTTTKVTFTGSVSGTIYNWVNDTPGIGLLSSGSGDIEAFTAINTGTTPVVATITVTPSYANGGTSCPGTPQTFTITVNPAPTVDNLDNQKLCSTFPTTAIAFSGPVEGTEFNWVNDSPDIGLGASGTGNIASFTATNNTTSPIVAHITVTPKFSNGGSECPGAAKTFTITIDPLPVTSPIYHN